MNVIVLILSLILSAYAEATPDEVSSCETDFPEEIREFKPLYNKGFLSTSKAYYLYFEAKSLEDLQTLKNCLDYSKCGAARESIVDDPKNYRMHIWTTFTKTELSNFMHSCPIKDLNKRLTIRKKDQQGDKVPVVATNNTFAQSVLNKAASPAIFHDPGVEVSKSVVEKVRKLINESNTKAAENLVLSTWGIDLKGYKLIYTGKPGSAAVTFHKSKKIEYGKDWLDEPCDFIRMIRHEAEHAAQVKRSEFCDEKHNFNLHKFRERAAHLNDARFIQTVCPGTSEAKLIRNSSLDRFRKDYFQK